MRANRAGIVLLSLFLPACAARQGVIVLDEGKTFADRPVEKATCAKRFMTPIIRVSAKKGPRTVRWTILNSCEDLSACRGRATVYTRGWQWNPQIIDDLDQLPDDGWQARDPFAGTCRFMENSPRRVFVQKQATASCTVAKNAEYGTYRYRVVYQCGDAFENRDPVVIIED